MCDRIKPVMISHCVDTQRHDAVPTTIRIHHIEMDQGL